MKRIAFFCIISASVSCLGLKAQDVGTHGHTHNHGEGHSHDHAHEHSLPLDTVFAPKSVSDTLVSADSIKGIKRKSAEDAFAGKLPNTYAWKISPRLGERTLVARDTLLYGFHQSMMVDGKDVAVGYLGNIGSPAQSKVFFNRPEQSRFMFLDGFSYWHKKPEDQLFYNTKVPYTNVYYQSAGSGETAENRLQTEMSINIGKKLNIGFDFDYLYARGFYNSLFNKQVNYDLYASYIGDKYKMHLFVANNNYNNSENGGLSNEDYIVHPDDYKGETNGKTLNYPVRFTETWNKLRGRRLYMTHKYDLGQYDEIVIVDDTTTVRRRKKDYVAPASVIFTTNYTDQRRTINSYDSSGSDLYNLYYGGLNGATIPGNLVNQPYEQLMGDMMSYWSLKNTLALSMNEGFRPWTKFGLTAFIEYDAQKYLTPEAMSIGTGLPWPTRVESENYLTIGGVLSKEKGENLLFKASADKNILGGDFRLQGDVTAKVRLLNKDLSAKATAYIKNIQPSFFENNFATKYWAWKNNFEDIRRVYVGGEIQLPSFSFSRTKISGGVENLQNYIYYGANGFPLQEGGSVQVIALRLDQELQAGILHWDNQLVYQTTTNDEVIPLPDLSIYTNLYITSKIAKVLTFQLGVDAHYHTKYYAPTYEAMTMQFYNQRDREVGNFPISSAYLNLNLKYTRFYVMMYNILEGMGDADAFTMYRYPVNPRGLRIGISWKFNN